MTTYARHHAGRLWKVVRKTVKGSIASREQLQLDHRPMVAPWLRALQDLFNTYVTADLLGENCGGPTAF